MEESISKVLAIRLVGTTNSLLTAMAKQMMWNPFVWWHVSAIPKNGVDGEFHEYSSEIVVWPTECNDRRVSQRAEDTRKKMIHSILSQWNRRWVYMRGNEEKIILNE